MPQGSEIWYTASLYHSLGGVCPRFSKFNFFLGFFGFRKSKKKTLVKISHSRFCKSISNTFQMLQDPEIWYTASVYPLLGGVFHRFSKFKFFLGFFDFRKSKKTCKNSRIAAFVRPLQAPSRCRRVLKFGTQLLYTLLQVASFTIFQN